MTRIQHVPFSTPLCVMETHYRCIMGDVLRFVFDWRKNCQINESTKLWRVVSCKWSNFKEKPQDDFSSNVCQRLMVVLQMDISQTCIPLAVQCSRQSSPQLRAKVAIERGQNLLQEKKWTIDAKLSKTQPEKSDLSCFFRWMLFFSLATEPWNKTCLLSIESWLFDRNPYNALL